MSVLDAESAVLAKMPHETLNKVTGVGDYLQLQLARNQVYQNLSAVPSTYGTGTDGHLGIGMAPTQYRLCTGRAFAFTADQGTYDTTIGAQVGANTRAKKEVHTTHT